MSGWGSIDPNPSSNSKTRSPDFLQKVKITVSSNEECIKTFKEHGSNFDIKDDNLCAGDVDGGFDACTVSAFIVIIQFKTD